MARREAGPLQGPQPEPQLQRACLGARLHRDVRDRPLPLQPTPRSEWKKLRGTAGELQETGALQCKEKPKDKLGDSKRSGDRKILWKTSPHHKPKASLEKCEASGEMKVTIAKEHFEPTQSLTNLTQTFTLRRKATLITMNKKYLFHIYCPLWYVWLSIKIMGHTKKKKKQRKKFHEEIKQSSEPDSNMM